MFVLFSTFCGNTTFVERRRWLYAQLMQAGEPGSCAVRSELGSTPYAFREEPELWLYVSHAPCGDAAVFSRADPCAAGGHEPVRTFDPTHNANVDFHVKFL